MLSCIRLFVTYGLSATIPCPWDFPDKNTGVGCHFLLQAIIMINLNKKIMNPYLCWNLSLNVYSSIFMSFCYNFLKLPASPIRLSGVWGQLFIFKFSSYFLTWRVWYLLETSSLFSEHPHEAKDLFSIHFSFPTWAHIQHYFLPYLVSFIIFSFLNKTLVF